MEHAPDGRQEFKEKIIAQKAVIKQGDRFLILLRVAERNGKPNAFAEVWDFPGGRLEKDEDPEQGLVREVKEETQLDIQPKGVQGVCSGQLKDVPIEFVIYSVEVDPHSLNGITLGNEHSEWRFATAGEIRQLPTMPYMEEYLNTTT